MDGLKRVIRTPLGVAALTMLVVVLGLAILAPWLLGAKAATIDTNNLLALPSSAHWVGTDSLGRDLLARTLVATRLSVVLALSATLVSVTLGLILGSAPALLGHRLGRLVTAIVNILVAFPGLLLCLFFAVIFGVGQVGAVFAIGLAGAPTFARLCHTLVAGVEERDYVAAARIAGGSRASVLVRHILPNIAEPMVVQATIGAGSCLLTFSGLSFLGLGVQQPAFDWGRLMNEGLNRIYLNPLAALAPGLFVIMAGLAFNLTGEAIARIFNVETSGSWLASGVVPSQPGVTASAHGIARSDKTVLSVNNLTVDFPGVTPVRGLSFDLHQGEALGIVGESGAGKTLTGLAIAQLIEPPGVVGGDVVFLGETLRSDGGEEQRKLLGTSMALVFQDPLSSFNPVRRVGEQLAEVSRVHQGMTRKVAWKRAVDRLRAVRISDPERRAEQHPHEFSGGMRQRAMIGMGLMASPTLLIADEPTTALDVTVQKQVLDLLDSIRTSEQVALILISHDLTLVGERCERIIVMYAGRVVEDLSADALPVAQHPYTRLLMEAVPTLATDLDQPLAVIPGAQPEPSIEITGCAFAPRCPLADDICRTSSPTLAPVASASGRTRNKRGLDITVQTTRMLLRLNLGGKSTPVHTGRVACWHANEPLPETSQLDDTSPSLPASTESTHDVDETVVTP
ncbi:MAG: dipeptide/oligopeptide/nickel ABC transporter permease/ATP-binding protein [Propionibacteriaceae bacterium]|jgi:oligopeptide/dipeptide ABC transporter ATP-binding protein|nr:dipeptide/oligopeptide/nickel ABC transporter permease/ATP-binding protein [Propionibacteriaceae bacterium]